jgi:hypothetical protein
MRNVSDLFLQAESLSIQEPALQVVVRPNPEALQWHLAYTGTGKDASDGSWGWRGLADPFYATDEDYPVGPGNGSACVTASGTLLRTLGVSSEVVTGTPPLYVNRVPAATPDSGLLAALRAWTRVQPASGPLPAPDNRTREAIASEGDKVRIFYVTNTGQIAFVTSDDDGLTWGPQVLIPSSDSVGLKALASPRPDLVFACERYYYAGTNGDPNTMWLKLIAFEFGYDALEGTTRWMRTEHPMPVVPVRYDTTNDLLRSGHLQFDAAMVDDDLAAVVFLDDAAGRPASTTYRHRVWSEVRAVEQIDFAEPERDDLIGLRLRTVGDKLLLHARRAQGDTDFAATKTGVLYWSVNGLDWSDAYYVGEQSELTWGWPVAWREALWLVGLDRLWRADPTPFLGGASPVELDITGAVTTLTVDEPEDGGSVTASLSVAGELRAYLDHPLLRHGSEIEIAAGYVGTELVRLLRGRIMDAAPSIERDRMTLAVQAADYRSNLQRGPANRVLSWPVPRRRVYPFTSEDAVAQVSILDGGWGWLAVPGAQLVRAREAGANTFVVSTGEVGDALRQFGNDYSFSVRIRFDNPAVSGVWGGNTYAAGMTAALIWGCGMPDDGDDLGTYYELRCGAGITRFELRKHVRVTQDVDGNPLAESLDYVTTLGTSGPGSTTDMAVNVGMEVRVTQRGQRIHCALGEWTLIDALDYAPLPASGMAGVRATLATGAPAPDAPDQSYATIFVDDLRTWGHDAQIAVEEVLRALATRRHLDAITLPSDRDVVFGVGSLGIGQGWTMLGPGDDWTSTANGLVYEDNSPTKAGGTLQAIRSTVAMQNGLVDLDMVLSETTANARMGVLLRCNAATTTYVMLTVTREGMVALDIVIGGVQQGSVRVPALVPLYPDVRATYRFVVDGPWYSVYCDGILLATIYDHRVMQAGFVGIASGLELGVPGTVTLHRFRVPVFGLGVLPEILPTTTLDAPFGDLLAAQNAHAVADGRSLAVRVPITSIATVVADDAVWTTSGYARSATEIATHVRVESEDADGFLIAGTAYSPTLWRRVGAEVWRIETVEGLRDEAACRDAAWRLLVEQERVARTRSYGVHPHLRWERDDLLVVRNDGDDTRRDLLVTGISRTWQRDEAGALRASMTVQLEERNTQTLVRGATYEEA